MSILEMKIDLKWKIRTDLRDDAECWECNETTPQHHWIYDTKTVSIAISQCKNCGSERKEEICPVCLDPIELSNDEILITGGKCRRCFEEAVSDNPELYV